MRNAAFPVLAATLLLAGCGGKGGTNASGAKVFDSARCGGCHTLSAAKSNGQTGPNHEQLSDCHGDYACYKQAFGNIAYYDGPETALARLASAMRTNQQVNTGCHQIAHEIGHAAYVRYHDHAAQALANGSMTCWSGYYHGVIERAFGGIPRSKVASMARSLW